MMYEHIVAKLREAYQDKDVSGFRKHFAIQFNVWGEGHGALYLEVKNGRVYVEPYEYFDRDTLISTDADTLLGIASGRIDPNNYFGDLYVEGDFYGLELLRDLSKKKSGEAASKPEEEPAFSMEEEEAESITANVKEMAGEAVNTVKTKVEEAAKTVKRRTTKKEKAEKAEKAEKPKTAARRGRKKTQA